MTRTFTKVLLEFLEAVAEREDAMAGWNGGDLSYRQMELNDEVERLEIELNSFVTPRY